MANEPTAPRFLKAIGFVVLAVPVALLLALFRPVGSETLAGTVISSGAVAGSGSDGGTVEVAWVLLADQRQISAPVRIGQLVKPGDRVVVLRERRASGADMYSVVARQPGQQR